jgi:NAD(P) transhydrogenase
VAPPKAQEFDLIVIGTGPGGEGAAMKAAKEGKRVAVIERFPRIGGACTHMGTIPSKVLRHCIQQLTEFRKSPLFQGAAERVAHDYPAMLRTAETVIAQQVEVRSGFYHRNHVPLIHGEAAFIDANTVEVAGDRGERKRYRADKFVIAVGTRPYRPEDVDFTHPRVLDSNKLLSLKETPRVLTIYGAGVIGCEYASIFRQLDSKINLVNTRGKLLDFLDDEMIDALAYHLRDRGVLIRHNEECDRVETHDDHVVLHLKSGKKLKSDYLLWANGRTGNTDRLGLDHAGIAVDHRGYIKVDEVYRSSVKHIYAVGDVVGYPSLASASYDQGRFAATHAVKGTVEHELVADIPSGIYTTPEISSVGATERELTEKKIPYEVGHAQFRHLARAQITGASTGMLKILFHRDSLEVLGVHCFGDQASEIIHIGQIVMAQKGEGNSLLYFIHTTFNYPTMAEAYRVAALNGYNRVR